MSKNRVRKNRKIVKPKDSSGRIITKNSPGKAYNSIIMRTYMLQDACNSLTSKEVRDIYNQAVLRRDSTETVKGPKPVLKHVTTVLDENDVPVSGETKEIQISNSDIARLESIFQAKEREEKRIKEKQEETIKT